MKQKLQRIDIHPPTTMMRIVDAHAKPPKLNSEEELRKHLEMRT